MIRFKASDGEVFVHMDAEIARCGSEEIKCGPKADPQWWCCTVSRESLAKIRKSDLMRLAV